MSSSRATRAPEMLVSPTRQRFSRQQSSLMAKILNLREAPNVSETKSIDHRAPGTSGMGIGVRLPRARFSFAGLRLGHDGGEPTILPPGTAGRASCGS